MKLMSDKRKKIKRKIKKRAKRVIKFSKESLRGFLFSKEILSEGGSDCAAERGIGSARCKVQSEKLKLGGTVCGRGGWGAPVQLVCTTQK